MNAVSFAIICALAALVSAFFLIIQILKASAGQGKMLEIAAAIQEGPGAFLPRQYKTVAVVGIVIIILMWFGKFSGHTIEGFILGAVLSAVAGFVGMYVSVRANVRTAEAAKNGLSAALSLAFKGGSVTGLFVAGLGLLSVTGFYIATKDLAALVGLAFGASLISVFARLGGGIFTKGADVGGDMVGKVEAGIPEDDPRIPATIADNVGDNVGDCAGMAADLFETYVVTTVATMVLASIYFIGDVKESLMLLPLAIAGMCIFTSIAGTFFVRLGKSQNIMGALYKGVIATGALSLLGLWPLMNAVIPGGMSTVLTTAGGSSFTGNSLFLCGIVGLAVTGALIWVSEYYTAKGYRPVKMIAAASVTGHGTNVIQGLAISMEATAMPALVICAAIITAYSLAGLFGIAIAVSTMLSLAGMIVALDAFGPVTDNAGGIAEMAGLEGDGGKGA